MARVSDCTDAQQYPLHPEGEGLAFKIVEVKDDVKDGYLVFELAPSSKDNGRCKVSQFVWNDPASYLLKMMCIACGLDPKTGFDSEQFLGKAVVCNIAHNKKKGSDKVYANIVPESLEPYGGRIDNAEDDLPF